MSHYNHNNIVPFANSDASKKQQVQEMFDAIAPRYDFLNRFMSMGIDVTWRKKVVKRLQHITNANVLDLATGTADLAIMLAKNSTNKITGIDISQQMLNVGNQKIADKNLQNIVSLQHADSENLPFNTNTFAAATVAFGVRNFQDLDKGLHEIYRVLQPNATFIILEFSKVKKFPIKQFYEFYFRYITPLIGKLLSTKQAYAYLPESVAAFPEGNQMISILHNIGFKNTTCTPLSFGIASIYQTTK